MKEAETLMSKAEEANAKYLELLTKATTELGNIVDDFRDLPPGLSINAITNIRNIQTILENALNSIKPLENVSPMDTPGVMPPVPIRPFP